MKLGYLVGVLLIASVTWGANVKPKTPDRKDWFYYPDCQSSAWNTKITTFQGYCPNLDVQLEAVDHPNQESLYELYCFTDRNGNGKFEWAYDDIHDSAFCRSDAWMYGGYGFVERKNEGDFPYQEKISSSQSAVKVDSQTSEVSIPIVGTNWNLTYNSGRTAGYKPGNQINIQYLSANPPAGVTNDGVHLQFFFDDKQTVPTFEVDVPVVAAGVYKYEWNRLDNLGNYIERPMWMFVRSFYDWPTSSVSTAFKYTAYYDTSYVIGNYLPQRIGMSGWNITPVHYLDERRSKMWRGDGTIENVAYQKLSSNIFRVLSKDGKELYVFDESGRHTVTRSTLNGEIIYQMNYSGGYLTKITDAFGNETIFNRSGQVLTSIVAPGGKTTTIAASTNTISGITNPAGETHTMTYNTGALLATHTYPKGQVTTFTYDGEGRVINAAEQFGSFWSLNRATSETNSPIYNSTNMLRTTKATKKNYEKWIDYPWGSQEYIDHDSNQPYRSHTHYDLKEGIVYTNDPVWTGLGTALWSSIFHGVGVDTTTVGYTINHGKSVTLSDSANLFSVSSINETLTVDGKVTQRTYDASTKTYTTTTPMSYVCSNVIDAKERPVQIQRGSETPWTFTYNTTNGKIAEINQGGRYKNTFTYDSSQNLTSVTNALSQTTSFTYDSADRVLTQTLPNSKVITYEYDSNGNLTGVTPPSRPKHVFAFNLFDGVSQYTPPTVTGSGNTSYTYNLDQQLSTITRPTGAVATYTYDTTKGLLTNIATPAGNYTVSYYANSIKPEDLTSPDGIKSHMAWYGFQPKTDQQRRTSDNYLFSQVQWTYNNYHLPASRTVSGNGTTASTINYTYNDDFQPTQVGDMLISYHTGSGRMYQTQLDKVKDTRVYDSNGDLSDYTATYDSILPHPFLVTTLYQYTLVRDDLGRITQKTETIGGVTDVWNYEYDLAGQLTKVKKNGTVYSEYVYDDNGNRTSGKTAGTTFTATYNNQDRLVTYNTRTYGYNANGDLSQIQWNTTQTSYYQYDMFGNYQQFTGTGGGVFNFITDAFNRRVGLKQGSTVTYRFLYQDQYRVAAQTAGAGGVQKEFVYATGGNSPDYMIQSGVKYRIIKDHLGSPRLVVKSDDGTIMQRLDYNDLGDITAETGTAFFQPFAFAGGLYEPNSKMVRFGARDYDPRSGRWNTKDPILFNSGETSLYGYAINDPINFVDPRGESPLLVGMAVGAFIGAMLTPTPLDQSISLMEEGARVFVGATIGAGVGATAVIAPAVMAAPNANPYIRIGEGKFPEPYSQRISLGNTPGKKAEIGISRSGRVDVKLGPFRTTIREGVKNTCGGD